MFRRYIPNFEFESDVLDVMAIYKDFYRYPWKLDEAVRVTKSKVINTHRAIDDALATWKLQKNLIIQIRTVDPYINSIGYIRKYGINGIKLNHVNYIPQEGAKREIISRT